MIKLIKMECPGCGAILKRRGFKTFKCSYCNSQYLLDVDVFVPVPDKDKKGTDKTKEQTSFDDEKQNQVVIKSKKPNQTASNSGRPNQTSQNYGRQSRSGTNYGKQGRSVSNKSANNEDNQNSLVKVVLAIAISCVLVGVICPLIVQNKHKTNRYTYTQTENNQKTYDSGKNTSSSNKSESIQSEFFREFVELAFEKEADKVTDKDCKEITLFVMHDNRYIVDYRRKDGEIKTVSITNDSSIDFSDLGHFPNIEVLGIDAYMEKNAVISNFSNLRELTCTTSPYFILQYLSHPEKIEKLSCKYYEKGEGLGELGRCKNLKDLSITMHISSTSDINPPDLSEIAKLEKLESFYLDGDDYLMISCLSELKELKSVTLHCDSLKDVSFLQQLSQLESLTLVDCDILNVDDLQYTPNLKVLRLEDCYQINSYLPVEKLVELEELMLSYHHGQEIPENFSKLSKVTRLTLAGFHDISFLSDFPDLTFLQLYGCNYSQFDKIACMKDLRELRVSGGTNLNSVAVLTKLQNLEKVDFWKMSTNADTELLFMIPNLKELNINDTEFTIDLNLVEENPSLEILYMENLKWSAYNTVEGVRKYNYANWERLPMGECIDFLTNFPNLKILSIQGNKVDSIEFTGSLTKLESLDITNNYVNDIEALNKLTNLKEVFCGENPLDDKIKLNEGIKVDYTTKGNERWPFLHFDW